MYIRNNSNVLVFYEVVKVFSIGFWYIGSVWEIVVFIIIMIAEIRCRGGKLGIVFYYLIIELEVVVVFNG